MYINLIYKENFIKHDISTVYKYYGIHFVYQVDMVTIVYSFHLVDPPSFSAFTPLYIDLCLVFSPATTLTRLKLFLSSCSWTQSTSQGDTTTTIIWTQANLKVKKVHYNGQQISKAFTATWYVLYQRKGTRIWRILCELVFNPFVYIFTVDILFILLGVDIFTTL